MRRVRGHREDRELLALLDSLTLVVRRATRQVEALRDELRLANDKTVRELGVEVFHPECLLSEDEVEEIRARQLYRTLQDIDDLPEE